MSSSTEANLETKSGFLAAGTSRANNPVRKKSSYVNQAQMHLETPEQCPPYIEQMFEKCFLYQKHTASNTWCLPPANELFQEYYQFQNLQELKVKLNQVKSQLNNYVIEDWSIHTLRQDPAGGIRHRLKTQTNAEFVTAAWCKMYEFLGRFPDLIKSPKVNSLHLCESPGAFITAMNHFLHTKYKEREIKWHWLATTLNPYYEGNLFDRMIMDDRFLFYTLDNWLFYKDFTGNIIDMENLQCMQQECEKRLGQVHFITADGSVDCMESPDCQEENVALLHFAEIIAALKVLSEGGSFIIKMFTMYEASSVSKMFLLNCAFEKVHVFKPCTSKRGSSEVYVVCLNYKKQTKNLPAIVDQMILQLNLQSPMLCPLFVKSALPADFLRQHEICCRIFMDHQINAIKKNIYSYGIPPNKTHVRRLQKLKAAVCNEYYKRYDIRLLPDKLKILYKFKSATNEIYCSIRQKGSHSERMMLKETSKEERILKLRKDLNELERILTDDSDIIKTVEVSNVEDKSKVNLTLYRGQGPAKLNTSNFVNINLLVIRNKLNKLYSDAIEDCLWFQNPRMEFYNSGSLFSVNFNDFITASGKLCQQQESFFKTLVSKLLEMKPNEVKFINMPFLTHYAASILRYLSDFVFIKLSFCIESKYEIVLNTFTPNFMANLEELKRALSSSQDHDILCVLSIRELHRNNFQTTLCTFNNNLLLKNFKHLLNN